ncbi:heavy metal translocating P-type ATPase [Paraburkholderia tropica]|uniref:Cd2+/Zn2+-exporting ATPase n=1 Tax=Paraburkholderia tropica TaxID=92647 RepID=A0AAQ1GJZ1_9BURK|nr:heavy metal translocating P-type ATPase [Paraburkholderia tropica]RQN34158.1 heavy metal translocating P-type ATPase [Paraburkholderia tropica]SEK04165.1 Cd2+/Zn2+-exporting ATPase [Paraburkholderia tropica]
MGQAFLSRLVLARRYRARAGASGADGADGAAAASGVASKQSGHDHKPACGCHADHGCHTEVADAAATADSAAPAGGHEHDHDHSHGHDHDHADHAHDHTHDHAASSCCQGAAPQPAARLRALAPAPEGTQRARYRIDNMDCPTEERLIRNRLEPMPGVARLDFDLIARELTVYHRLPDAQPLESALRALDMAPRPLADDDAGNRADAGLSPGVGLALRQKLLLAASGVAAAGAEVLAWTTGHETGVPVLICAVVSLLCAGLPTLRKGWIALKNFTINIYFLMSLAVAGAIVIGKWPEAAMVVFLFALAEQIEALSLERARNAIRSLTALAPETADVWSAGEWRTLAVADVAVDSRIRVRTGERVPLDARVESGRAALDQAPITGESLPVDKAQGDALYAGSIVVDGVVEARVTAVARDSTLARIAAAVQEAQAQRAPTQRFVDQFARYYTPAVVALAVLIAVAGPLAFGGAWSAWLYKALVLLVIACPCALVVSTPVTVVSGLAAAARAGILVKGGVWLERGRLLKAVALDKTGTLTRGQPALTDAFALGALSVDDALHLAASLDDASTHPVARAVVAGWRTRAEQGAQAALVAVDDFAVLSGLGVKGRIAGEVWHLGNHRLVESLGVCSPDLEARLATLETQGKTAIVLCSPREAVALFAVADAVRPESADAVRALKQLGVTPVMLTGDNPATARAIAAQLGIDDARGNLLPQDKQDAVADLSARHGMTAMVGDGVNDAPALARADIGFAMGAAGTATALETADVAIMDDDPRKIAAFVGLSRKVSAVLMQNIALALGIKAVFLVLALAGEATLWMAVFADVGASLLVVANGLRVRRHFGGVPVSVRK